MNTKFAKSLELDYPILSDPTKKAAKAFGVLGLKGKAMRHTVYVDKAGKIAFFEREVKAREDGSRVAKRLAALKIDKAKKPEPPKRTNE